MELPIVVAVLVVGALVLARLPWRPRGRRPRTAEEALEERELAAERDRLRTDAIRAGDRYNVRG